MGIQLKDSELARAMKYEDGNEVTEAEINAPITREILDEVFGNDTAIMVNDALDRAQQSFHQESVVQALVDKDWCELGRRIGEAAVAELEASLRAQRGY